HDALPISFEKRPRGRRSEYRLIPRPRASAGCSWSSSFPSQTAAAYTASVVGRARPLAQPVALADHLDDRGVREETIENRRRGGHVAEEDAPILRRPIRRDECRRGFVASHEDFEEVLRRIRGELRHAEVFQDEEIDTRELLDQIAALTGGLRLSEVGREIEGAAHERAAAGADRADGKRGGDMRFADTGWADQQHAAVRVDEARAGQLHDLRLRDLRIEGPLKIGERLHRRDPGLFHAPGEEPIRAAAELVLDEELEKLEFLVPTRLLRNR